MSLLGHQGLISGQNLGPFRDVVLALSPLCYYPLGEASGTTVNALAGTNGLYLGAPTLGRPKIVPTDVATSVGTSNAANRARVPIILDGSTDFTICLAVRTSFGTAQMLVFDQDVVSGSAPRHFLAINRSGTNLSDVLAGAVEVFNFNGSTNRGLRALGAGVSDGQPHLIVYGRSTVSGVTTAFIDIDGVPQTLSGEGMAGNDIFSGTYWGVGQSASIAVLPYNGDVGHFAVWSRRLSPAERAQLASASGL